MGHQTFSGLQYIQVCHFCTKELRESSFSENPDETLYGLNRMVNHYSGNHEKCSHTANYDKKQSSSASYV